MNCKKIYISLISFVLAIGVAHSQEAGAQRVYARTQSTSTTAPHATAEAQTWTRQLHLKTNALG